MNTLIMRTDEELVALYATGMDDAFDILLERYKDRLYSYILYNVRNADVAEDIFQETFVKVIITIRDGRYTESGKFFSWVTRIAHNLVIDFFRREKGENTISTDETEVDLLNNAKLAERSAQGAIDSEQTLVDLHLLINKLPQEQREVVHMHYFQEMTFKEIAEEKGISINTALGRMRYGILNMRKMANKFDLGLCL
ncbi:MAG: sigma-70 family RNA polymerase sigma factor [Bacteroidaceae bacterium]|jgi:RNA polymerase sigma-70 factor (ECF subfamily)|nr:sigma-70 family RNA polymerase sigma factor [Bacteroidaceae bacterium]